MNLEKYSGGSSQPGEAHAGVTEMERDFENLGKTHQQEGRATSIQSVNCTLQKIALLFKPCSLALLAKPEPRLCQP